MSVGSEATAIKLAQDSLWDPPSRHVVKTPESKIEESLNSLVEANVPEYLKSNKAHLLAAAINSREGVRRVLLEVTGFELPELTAAILTKRPKANLIEIFLKNLYLILSTALDPKINSTVTKLAGKLFIPKALHKDIHHISKFTREDLEDIESFKRGLENLKHSEVQDQHFLAGVSLSENQRESALTEAESVYDFAQRFIPDETNLDAARKIKNVAVMSTTIGGMIRGFLPIFNNVIIRQKLLKQEGFTGVDSKHMQKFKGFSPIQKFGMTLGVLTGPLVNAVLLPFSNMKSGKFAQAVKKWQDLTHGKFPKLGLLLTNLTLPINITKISASMSKIELFENVASLCSVILSWSFGHRITEDQLSNHYNSKLKDQYALNEDILIKTSLDKVKKLPESAEIREILEKTKQNPELQRDAIKFHTRRTWGGITLHSMLIFAARMLINMTTKKITAK